LREVLKGRRAAREIDRPFDDDAGADFKIASSAGPESMRVACPPIIAPCFYGIDMSRIRELFARHFGKGAVAGRNSRRWRRSWRRFAPLSSGRGDRAIGKPADQLCRA
jgi:amidophosphoribosyltransferase